MGAFWSGSGVRALTASIGAAAVGTALAVGFGNLMLAVVGAVVVWLVVVGYTEPPSRKRPPSHPARPIACFREITPWGAIFYEYGGLALCVLEPTDPGTPCGESPRWVGRIRQLIVLNPEGHTGVLRTSEVIRALDIDRSSVLAWDHRRPVDTPDTGLRAAPLPSRMTWSNGTTLSRSAFGLEISGAGVSNIHVVS